MQIAKRKLESGRGGLWVAQSECRISSAGGVCMLLPAGV